MLKAGAMFVRVRAFLVCRGSVRRSWVEQRKKSLTQATVGAN